MSSSTKTIVWLKYGTTVVLLIYCLLLWIDIQVFGTDKMKLLVYRKYHILDIYKTYKYFDWDTTYG